MTQHYPDALSSEQSNGTPPPCQNYPTIFDNLVPPFPLVYAWEYHAHEQFGFWSAPMAIQRFANYHNTGQPIPNFMVDPNAYTYITTEVPQGNTAAVTYLIPCPGESDHANETTNNGPNWVATVLNAIGANTSLWNQTAVFIVWDDWGGWFDHDSNIFSPFNVYPNGSGPPPNRPDPYEWGFRVPLIVVSPYVKQSGYISHIPGSYSAILNFIEWNWNLASLGADDAANLNYQGADLRDVFDFKRSPMPYGSPLPTGSYRLTNTCQ